jgi:hypothetical protein
MKQAALNAVCFFIWKIARNRLREYDAYVLKKCGKGEG